MAKKDERGGGGGAPRPTAPKKPAPKPAPRKPVVINSHGLSTNQVKALQRKLGIPADGKYGPQTRAAVTNYQRRKGLAVDGIAGRQTLGSLGLSGGGSSGGGGAAPKKAATSAKPANWENSAEGKAANFGWSLAVINSNAELKKIFGQANKENWTPDRFVAKVRDTQWFKKTSATARQALILQKADPATYKSRISSLNAQARVQAQGMGAEVTSAQLNSLATQALQLGWNADQMKVALAAHIKPLSDGRFTGEAAANQRRYQEMGQDYGIDISAATMASWVKGSALGRTNEETLKSWMIAQAASRFPPLADRLKAGETLAQIADPYIQSYAKTLEINGETVSLRDAHIQNALAGKNAAGQPEVKSIWQFEQDLRKDPRFMKTQQAQDQSMAVAHKVLQDFGFAT